MQKKQCYRIRIEGLVTADWSSYFNNVTILHTEDHTILTGELPDQTALHGVLMRIRDLGLSLVEVKRIVNPTTPNKRSMK